MADLPRHTLLLALLALCFFSGRTDAAAPQDDAFAIRAAGGRFEPTQLLVAAGVAFKVTVTNAEATPIEFESFELHRERVVQPGNTITVYIPALSPGTYKFFDDFHHDTPEGEIVAK